MKVSIVVAVLNSHEVVRRQLRHFGKMELPDDVEIILVDDGSDPPLSSIRFGYFETVGKFNLQMPETRDFRPWTQPLARNAGVRLATGDFLILTDIDHIVTRAAIELARNFRWDYGRFRREFGVLDEQGNLTQDVETLVSYGFPRERLAARGLRLPCHTNSLIIRRGLWWEIGGNPEDRLTYPNREEAVTKRRLLRLQERGTITKCPDGNPDLRETLYMFPNGEYCGDKDHNPFGLFHHLSRKPAAVEASL
jgi:glycosyltransferase involved in cell wall biosynthesis